MKLLRTGKSKAVQRPQFGGGILQAAQRPDRKLGDALVSGGFSSKYAIVAILLPSKTGATVGVVTILLHRFNEFQLMWIKDWTVSDALDPKRTSDLRSVSVDVFFS